MHKLRTGILISLYLLLVTHLYLEVPGFLFLYVLLCVLVLLVSWKEATDHNKKLDAVPYDFRIQKAEKANKKQELLGYTVFVLSIVVPYFIEFPFEQRVDADDIFPFLILFGILVYTTLLMQPQYDYYLFGEQCITGPGPELQPIPWRDIRAVETIKDKEIFYLKLKNDTSLIFDLKRYYSDRKWEDVMVYLEERGVESREGTYSRGTKYKVQSTK